MTIETLINSQDVAEQIRDAVAVLLSDESASQQTLAVAAGEDPNLWNYDVYTERSNCWERWIPQSSESQIPVVNVFWESASAIGGNSDTFSSQRFSGTFNIDCMAIGHASEYVNSDQDAAENAQRVARIVRNIIMSAHYINLGFPAGVIGRRHIRDITTYQQPLSEAFSQQIVATRLSLVVEYNEYSPQHVPSVLEAVNIEVARAADGRVLAESEITW